MPAALLIPLYLFLALLPLGLAWAQGLPPRHLMDELASGAGLVAMAMILAEFFLLGRFRSITRRAGSDVVMRAHQLLARAALVLVVLHPVLYVSPMVPPPVWDVTAQGALNYGWTGLWPGIAALLLLGGLVAMAIGRDICGLRYEVWRLLHGLGAVLVAGFGVLHALRAGRYSADPVLGWVWLALLTLALAALAWVYVLAPLRRWRRPWRVAAIRPAATRTWTVTLDPAFDGGLDYRAGQFAWVNIGRGVFSLDENPFSVSSAPASGQEVEFIIKELGDFTGTIGQIRPGTRAWLEAPHGHLTHSDHPDAPGIALIAGGVGIAPLIGILREMEATSDTRPCVLLYGNRTEAQIVARDELDRIGARAGTEIVHVLSEPPEDWTGATGLIDADLLRARFADPSRHDWLYVLCGPPPMMRAVEDALLALSIPSRRILSEQFVYD
ncbi:ferric reductase-like transmembrane domain-containing protein [Roseovarius autotrophicus]|uniref:ferredoxin reductase family protein n=1 Tax=Roseovarius autotrophicus TaxID=2824121 RepID=UPI001B39B399|nr:ferric reductase-like transmembrane domain-containing protein [Roseovarius autotrophicus]